MNLMPRPVSAAVAVLALALAAPRAVRAEPPRLAHVFQDNGVLQRDAPVPVWGWAEPDAEAVVEFAGQAVRARAGADGRWQATLAPMPASAEGRTLTARVGDVVLERKNLLVGEVWIAAGQSNMNHAGPDLDTGVYPVYVPPAGARPEARILEFGWGAELEPLPDTDPAFRGDRPWTTLPASRPGQAGGIPQYFARILRDQLDVPVGIIRVAVSGTNQAAWMARETLESFPGAAGHANFYREQLASREETLAKGGGPIKSWADFKAAEDAWRPTRRGVWPGRSISLTLSHFPAALYNTRIHPLAPYAIRGVLWHQGEAGPGGPYGARLVAMIRQWRERFGQDFHFVWGTLSRNTVSHPPMAPHISNFYRSSTNNGIRDARRAFGDDPRVEWVELYDLGNHDTHFNQKAEAGRRYALAALTLVHGQRHVFSGPRLRELKIEGGRAVARFDLAGGGLEHRPSIDGISGVFVQGKSGPGRWAQVAVTAPDTLEIRHPENAEIEAVGYAVSPNPHETLFNAEGLPASPFGAGLGVVRSEANAADTPLVRQTVPAGERGAVSLAHVRREGFVFQVRKDNAGEGATVAVEVYVPAEWNGVEVRSGGRALEAAVAERDGKRFASFAAPAGGAWVVVGAPGRAAALEKVNRY